MIRRPTVLILGAGASAPYKFPLGAQLVDLICHDILENAKESGLRSRLEEHYTEGPGQASLFAQSLRAVKPYSIDSFLQTNPQYRTVGKAAIADVLVRAEKQKYLDLVKIEDDWYRYLLHYLTSRSMNDYMDQAAKLAVITFNFDRSFERVLHTTLKHRFHVTKEKALELTKLIEVHHVHGCLGEPSWLYPDHPEANPYGITKPDELTLAVKKAVAKIKIVDDEIPRDVIERLQIPLRAAQFVYFIGFGFDERNIARLGAPEVFDHSAIVRATCLNVTTLEQKPIERALNKWPIYLHPIHAHGFLRNHAEALFE
jgi:hypothetical protein